MRARVNFGAQAQRTAPTARALEYNSARVRISSPAGCKLEDWMGGKTSGTPMEQGLTSGVQSARSETAPALCRCVAPP